MNITPKEIDRITREAAIKAVYEFNKQANKIPEPIKKHTRKRSLWSIIPLAICSILLMFSPESKYYQIGVAMTIILQLFGIRSDYTQNRLDNNSNSVLDKVSNVITGVRKR